MSSSSSILVTGANGEFGKLTAQNLLNDGHTVVGSIRDPEGRNKASSDSVKAAGAYIIEIDVTDDDSVNQGVKSAVEIAGSIDVVVNNAGVGAFGIQETFTNKDWQELFDVNVFGVQRIMYHPHSGGFEVASPGEANSGEGPIGAI